MLFKSRTLGRKAKKILHHLSFRIDDFVNVDRPLVRKKDSQGGSRRILRQARNGERRTL